MVAAAVAANGVMIVDTQVILIFSYNQHQNRKLNNFLPFKIQPENDIFSYKILVFIFH